MTVSLIVFYHRPLDEAFHGLTHYVRRMVSQLAPRFRVVVVAPRTGGERGSLHTISYLLSTSLAQISFLMSMRRGTEFRTSRLIVADIYGAFLPLLFARITEVPLVYVAADPGRVYTRSLARLGLRGASILGVARRLVEKAVIQSAEFVVCTSNWMRSTLIESGLEPSRVMTVPYQSTPREPNNEKITILRTQLELINRLAVVFVGNCRYAANRRAADFIVQELAPILADTAPAVRLVLAGPGTDCYAKRCNPNTTALGPVEDLDTLLYSSDVGLSPMVAAGGTSVKTVDYIDHGLVCVVTPEVARCLDPNPELVVAELPGFAQGVLTAVQMVQRNRVLRMQVTSRNLPRQRLEEWDAVTRYLERPMPSDNTNRASRQKAGVSP